MSEFKHEFRALRGAWLDSERPISGKARRELAITTAGVGGANRSARLGSRRACGK